MRHGHPPPSNAIHPANGCSLNTRAIARQLLEQSIAQLQTAFDQHQSR
ncbi:hypothetical protein SAMN02745117_01990 [Lampropedia hyalina DSM 16112]|uniref:Uncharacterized protein n=1 Tax=Lampropedia hyalina DSM 16112 TaxID=1122156 RepID=A0A1M5BTU4_9BURK|nr:hypothetical protein SAMN02745117_01990 [Lampropedia hyalina DSM 16112]